MIQAGLRDAMHVNYYFGARVLLAVAGFAGVVLFSGFDNLFLLVGVPGLGFFLPRFILKRMIKDRQQRIRLALPDALDLTVICVEAGLALDQALMRVGEDLHHAHPDLSDEFHLVNLEMRAGKPRADALRNLVDRTGVDDIRSLVGTLIQTDRFAHQRRTGLARALRLPPHGTPATRRRTGSQNHDQDGSPVGDLCSAFDHFCDHRSSRHFADPATGTGVWEIASSYAVHGGS